MKTYDEQREHFLSRWPEIRAALEAGGVEAGIDVIRATEDELERRVLFLFARQGVLQTEWEGRTLDAGVAFADAAIETFLAEADAAGDADPETRDRRIDTANVLSYNLAADLAPCWDDPFPRERRHFERGLRAAEDCLRWREQLGKPPFPFATAHWARGIHLFALGDRDDEALAEFERSLERARESAALSGEPTSLEDGGEMVVLAEGWVALAKALAGDTAARDRYESILTRYRADLESDDDERRDDAKMAIDQLERARAMREG